MTVSAAAAASNATSTGVVHGVVLAAGGSRYLVDLAAVAEVVPVPAVTRVPAAPGWLLGVVNWRGRVLPVLDLRPLAELPSAPLATSARLVVISTAGVECGLLAELVPGLLTCSLDGLQSLPPTVPLGVGALVTGIVDDGGPVAVLDPGSVAGLSDQLGSLRRAR